MKNFFEKIEKIFEKREKCREKSGVKGKFLWKCVIDFVERYIADVEIFISKYILY